MYWRFNAYIQIAPFQYVSGIEYIANGAIICIVETDFSDMPYFKALLDAEMQKPFWWFF